MVERISKWIALFASTAMLVACSGGGGDDPPPPPPPQPVTTYTLGGSIAGLAASGLVLQLSGGGTLSIVSGATVFSFIDGLASGTNYAVWVLTQPTGQTCTVANGSGNAVSANINNVAITCTTAPPTFTIGGSIAGLTASGLVLLLNDGSNLSAASGATAFTFARGLVSGAAYAVTVLIQPTGQTCTITNGASNVVSANVTNVAITCTSTPSAPTFSVGGSVTGLTASGLVLQLNGASNLTVAASTTSFQTFATRLLTGADYTVSVLTQPSNPAQQCTVANGAGTIATADVVNVMVTCADAFSVGGTVSGLTGTLSLSTLFAGANAPATQVFNVLPGATSFTVPVNLLSAVSFRVAVAAQPANQTCIVARGQGVTDGNNISGIAVTCAARTPSALEGSYANGALTFFANGSYTQSQNNAVADCGIESGPPVDNGVEFGIYNWNSSTGEFRSLVAPVDTNGDCGLSAPDEPVGVSGTLTKSGNTITITLPDEPQPFVTTAIASTTGSLSGTFAVTGVNGVSITFLTDGTFWVVSTQGRPDGAFNTGATVGFERGCYSSTTVSVTLSIANTCVLPNGAAPRDTSGPNGLMNNVQTRTVPYTLNGDNLTIGGLVATRVVVNAVPSPPTQPANTHTVGGTITGLTSSGLVLQLNNGNSVAVPAGSGTFTFSNFLAAGSAFTVTVLTQPSGPTQRCTVSNGSDTIASANAANVTVNCTTPTTFTVSGTVTGLTGTLQIGLFTGPTATETLTLTAGTAQFTYSTALATGTAFGSVITSQPNGQTCIITRSSGLVAASDLTGTLVTCIANTTSPLAGTFAGNFAGSYMAMTFEPDGRYLLVLRQPDSDGCRNAANQLTSNGIEYGVYNLNSATGVFRAVTSAVDTTGECGFVSDGGGAPFLGTLTRNGNSLFLGFTDDDGNPATITLTAAANTTGQLLGTYSLPNGRLYSFLGDGTYFVTMPQDRVAGAASNTAAIGFEQGCFTNTSTTIAFNMSNSCVLPNGKPPVDLNGGVPFKTNANLTGTLPYTLTGNSLVLYSGSQFAFTVLRIESN